MLVTLHVAVNATERSIAITHFRKCRLPPVFNRNYIGFGIHGQNQPFGDLHFERTLADVLKGSAHRPVMVLVLVVIEITEDEMSDANVKLVADRSAIRHRQVRRSGPAFP